MSYRETVYKVYGDYGTQSECVLFETKYLYDAIAFGNGYTKRGDLGGYDIIEVLSIDEEGDVRVESNWFNEDVYAVC